MCRALRMRSQREPLIFVLKEVVNFKCILTRHPHNPAQLVLMSPCMEPAEQINLCLFKLKQGGCSDIRGGPSSTISHPYLWTFGKVQDLTCVKDFSCLCAWVLVHWCCKGMIETGCEIGIASRSPGVTTDSGGLVLLGVRQQPPVQGRTWGRHGAIAFSQHCPGADKPQPWKVQLPFMEPRSLGSPGLLAQGASLE